MPNAGNSRRFEPFEAPEVWYLESVSRPVEVVIGVLLLGHLSGCGLLLDQSQRPVTQRNGNVGDAVSPDASTVSIDEPGPTPSSQSQQDSEPTVPENFATLTWVSPRYIAGIDQSTYGCARDCSLTPDGQWLVAFVYRGDYCPTAGRQVELFPFDQDTAAVTGPGVALNDIVPAEGFEIDGEVFDATGLAPAGYVGFVASERATSGAPPEVSISVFDPQAPTSRERETNISDTLTAAAPDINDGLSPSLRWAEGWLLTQRAADDPGAYVLQFLERQQAIWVADPVWTEAINASGSARDASVSPDGRAIVLIRDTNVGGGPIYLALRDGPSLPFGEPELLFDNEALGPQTRFEGPSFAPDGTLTFAATENGSRYYCAIADPMSR